MNKKLMCSAIFFGMLSVNSSYAADTGSLWAWSVPTSPNYSFTIQMNNKEGNTSFYLTNTTSGFNLDNSRLIFNNSVGSSNTIFFISENSKNYAYLLSDSSNKLELTDGNFYFTFSTDGVYDPTYEWVSAGTNMFTLKADNKVMDVTLANATTPSAVPIPGSALLLGSSLLGLVGIGSRRKKA